VVAPPEPPPSSEPAEPPPAATESADAGAAQPPKTSGGGPIMLKTDPKEITDTFASGQTAKIVLGEGDAIVTLKIPSQSLSRATNITFKLDPKAKPGGGVVGKIYHLTGIFPPEPTPSEVESAGAPFELMMPAGSKKDANLAIGVIDPANGKVAWQIIAPTRIDDAANLAYFELLKFSDVLLHVTTKAPTEKK